MPFGVPVDFFLETISVIHLNICSATLLETSSEIILRANLGTLLKAYGISFGNCFGIALRIDEATPRVYPPAVSSGVSPAIQRCHRG